MQLLCLFVRRLAFYTSISLLLGLGIFRYSQAHPEFASQISEKITGLSQLAYQQGWLATLSPIHEHDVVTDYHVAEQPGVRWQKNQATVFIDTENDILKTAYLAAIENWNATGSFAFKLVEDKRQANIIATVIHDSSITAAGLADSTTNPLTNRFITVTVSLNSYYLLDPEYGYDMARITYTAEHELGHAIGLDHTDETSVMQSAGSFYGIQDIDIQAVNQLYQSDKPWHGDIGICADVFFGNSRRN